MGKRILAEEVLQFIAQRRVAEVIRIQCGKISGCHGGKKVKIRAGSGEVLFRVLAPDGRQDITAYSSAPHVTAHEIGKLLRGLSGLSVLFES